MLGIRVVADELLPLIGEEELGSGAPEPHVRVRRFNRRHDLPWLNSDEGEEVYFETQRAVATLDGRDIYVVRLGDRERLTRADLAFVYAGHNWKKAESAARMSWMHSYYAEQAAVAQARLARDPESLSHLLDAIMTNPVAVTRKGIFLFEAMWFAIPPNPDGVEYSLLWRSVFERTVDPVDRIGDTHFAYLWREWLDHYEEVRWVPRAEPVGGDIAHFSDWLPRLPRGINGRDLPRANVIHGLRDRGRALAILLALHELARRLFAEWDSETPPSLDPYMVRLAHQAIEHNNAFCLYEFATRPAGELEVAAGARQQILGQTNHGIIHDATPPRAMVLIGLLLRDGRNGDIRAGAEIIVTFLHELAHVALPHNAGHGPIFLRAFREIFAYVSSPPYDLAWQLPPDQFRYAMVTATNERRFQRAIAPYIRPLAQILSPYGVRSTPLDRAPRRSVRGAFDELSDALPLDPDEREDAGLPPERRRREPMDVDPYDSEPEEEEEEEEVEDAMDFSAYDSGADV
jgi:hypothetical protein